MIHVALADDHPLVLDALGELIDQQPDMVVVARWTDGNAVVENIGSVDCDVLVLDLSLPGASGFGVLRALPDVAPTTRTLVYTMYPASLTRWGVLATGAKGWVCKREPPDAVIAGIRRIATGDIEAPEPSPAEGLSPRQRE
ncbi:MAG: response regulator transcription factor, partial [Myxococcales bacterium]|nr:response regulator transcription factor [Myxococcales bacterium]